MRVIAGTFRSRLLAAPRGLSTRPTSDRLRETLFNVLGTRIAGSRFADLYAGSGAVGIEAVSRGAAEVFFAENAVPAAAAIRANLRALGITGGFQVESGGVAVLLRRLRATPLDIVFLDPPYEDAAAYQATLGDLGADAARLLNPEAVVVAEHAHRAPPADGYGALVRTRVLRQGDAALSFYAVKMGKDP